MLVSSLSAQRYFYQYFSVKDGLSQSQVYSLYQDPKGYLWIGTIGGGINIYDGIKFKNITTDDGLAGNMVFSIIRDKNGTMWFGTDQGLSKYDGKSFKNYNDVNGLPNKYVYKLFESSDGKIYIGTGKGIAVMDNDSIYKLTGNKQIENTIIYSIIEDNNGTMWFGTNGQGVFKYKDNKFKQFIISNEESQSNRVWTLTINIDGSILAGTSKGLYRINNDKLETIKSYSSHLGSFVDADSINWFVSYTGWLYSLTMKNDNFYMSDQYLFNGFRIRTSIKDRENNIWLGTEEGLIKFPPPKFVNYNEKDSLHNNNIFAITQSGQNEFWVTASSKGVAKMTINPASNQASFENYPFIPYESNTIASNSVYSVVKNRDGKIWFGTWGGISIFDPETKEFTNYTSDTNDTYFNYEPNLTSKIINNLMISRDNTIWICTINGITYYKDSVFTNFNKTFPIFENQDIIYAYEDSKNNIWFTSKNGIYKYDRKTVKYYGEKEGFVNDIVNTIQEDSLGNYWFATKKGIFHFDGKAFTNINKKQGLSSNNIYLILIYKNKLYIGSNKGIDILNVDLYNDNDSIQIKHYGELEGFIGQECNRNAFMVDNQGKLWFGTIAGITIYDPAKDLINNVKPLVFINDIKLGFDSFNWFDFADSIDVVTNLPFNLTLPYNKNHISFYFNATSLTIPEKVRYKYMLEGLNDKWSPPVSKTEVDFPALPPGNYTFKVLSCNNDGIWSETPAEFSFTITPPFWKTTWFYILVTIFSVVIIYIYIKRREANLRKEKMILEEKVRERTAEIVRQKEIVEQKNKDITDSINYAKNIQEAIIPSINEFRKYFLDSFILYKPRDIVSGDFYWITEKNDKVFFTAADCTGHGVPGAFMSMLGIAFLDDIVNSNEHFNAAQILDELREMVIISLHQNDLDSEQQLGFTSVKDGMDIALCVIDKKNNKLDFAGANNPLYLIRDGQLIEYKGDKQPVGMHILKRPFTNHSIDLKKDDILYMFSDGYADQFGGPHNSKFKIKQLKNLLLEICHEPMNVQKEILDKKNIEWMGNHNQLDDILIMGVKIT
ncbi:MAG: hypothetical protein Kow0068_07870 [Marinilabiliales bacterium]